MKTHRGGVRLQESLHDTCHDVLSSHSLSFLAPLQAVILCMVSFSLPVSAGTIFFSYPAALCESEQRANSKPLGITTRFCGDYIPPHANTLEHALTGVCACLTCCDAHLSVYLPPNAAQLATALNQKSEGGNIWSESDLTWPALQHWLYKKCSESTWWMDACDEKTYSPLMKHVIQSSYLRAPVSLTVNYWVGVYTWCRIAFLCVCLCR